MRLFYVQLGWENSTVIRAEDEEQALALTRALAWEYGDEHHFTAEDLTELTLDGPGPVIVCGRGEHEDAEKLLRDAEKRRKAKEEDEKARIAWEKGAEARRRAGLEQGNAAVIAANFAELIAQAAARHRAR